MRRIAPGCQSAAASGGGCVVDALDRQVEILHPRREHLAQHAPGFLDIEFRGLLFAAAWMLVPWPDMAAILRVHSAANEQPGRRGLKMPDFRPYDAERGEWVIMFRRLALIFSVVAMGSPSMAAPNAVRSGTTGCNRRNPASRTVFSRACSAWRRDWCGGILPAKCKEHPMRIFCAAAVIALLAGAGLRATVTQHQSDPGAEIQNAGGKGAGGGPAKGLQGTR